MVNVKSRGIVKMDLELSFLILIVCVALVISAVTLIKSPRNKINQYFAITCFFVPIWIISNYSSDAFSSHENIAKLFVRADFSSSVIGVGFFMMFSLYFPKKLSNYKEHLDKYLIAFIAGIGILSTSKYVMNIQFNAGGISIINGELFYLYIAVFLLYLGVSIYSLVKKYGNLNVARKSQIKLIFFGLISVVIIGLITNVIIPSFLGPNDPRLTSIPRIGAYSVILFFGMSAYAILRHGLFDFKIITTEALVIVILVLLFVDVLTSTTLDRGIVRFVLFILSIFGGFKLIQSINRETKQREELELLAKKLEDANAHLKELDKMKDDFLSMASHELNTPLAAIEGYLSMILEEHIGGDLNPQVREYLDRIDKSAIRLAAIVKDLLNVSRIESGRIHLIYKEVQIEDLIEAAINEIMPKVKELGHTVTFKRPEQLMPKDWLDDTRITEVVLNMLGNAVKYTPGGGKIEVGVEDKEHEILVWVKDNGKGIPKDKTDRVFQKFTQVDVLKDEVKGTGLGMYISQKFIELHKGKIWFESEGEGKGSIFYFSIPILKDKPFDPNEGAGPVLK